MSANRYVSGFVSTTARSSKRAKAFGFCLSFCPPKVPGSTPSSRSGCMPRRLLWNPMGCSRLSSWLNAFVLTLAAPMNLLFSLSKRLRDYALEAYCREAPQTPSSVLQALLHERFALRVSVSQINRVRAALGVSNHPKSQEQGKKRE